VPELLTRDLRFYETQAGPAVVALDIPNKRAHNGRATGRSCRPGGLGLLGCLPAEVGRLLVRRGQEFSEDGGGDVLVAQQLLAQAHIDLDGARSLVWSQADDNKLDEAITLSLVDRCGHVGRKSTASSTSLASSVAIASLCRVTVVLGSATRRAVRSAQRGAVPASGSSSCCGGAPRKISTSLTSKAARPSSVFRLNDAGTQPSRVRR
jgi:hypothetical protein